MRQAGNDGKGNRRGLEEEEKDEKVKRTRRCYKFLFNWIKYLPRISLRMVVGFLDCPLADPMPFQSRNYRKISLFNFMVSFEMSSKYLELSEFNGNRIKFQDLVACSECVFDC